MHSFSENPCSVKSMELATEETKALGVEVSIPIGELVRLNPKLFWVPMTAEEQVVAWKK